jgi:hypothetical protein
MREHPEPRPRDHTDAAKDIEPQTSPENIASQIATFNGEANTYLGDPNYNHAKAAQNGGPRAAVSM